jgi:hypothetical protein
MRSPSQAAWHRLRIGLKRFRYIVENFLPLQHETWSDDLKELQDLLGEVHDLDVLWATALAVNAFPDQETRLRWHRRILEERNRRIQTYKEKTVGKSALWPLWRAELPHGNQIRSLALRRLKLWASLLDPDVKHAAHVARLARQLYDSLPARRGAGGSHAEDERAILQLAALLHDVGLSEKGKGHHKVSHKLIRTLKPPLGWSAGDMSLAGIVARYHRGALPRAGQKALLGLTSRQRQVAVRLAGILRLANAFDADHTGRIQRIEAGQQNGFLIIAARGYDSRSRTAERIAGARHLLETIYHSPILVKAQRDRLKN